ncbi:MAG TPA: hypothetical protein VGX78_16225 [Pirellulales bacterium]|nr:hypothetical protein [Pirellulales bacterium]
MSARGNPGFVTESSEAARLAREYVGSFDERLRLAAENRFRRQESDRLETGAGDQAPVALAAADAESQRSLAGIIEENSRPYVAELEKAAADATRRVQELEQRWLDVRTDLYAQRLQLFEIRANRQIAGQLASLMSVDNRWFWLCGLVAMASLVAVAGHDRRHEVRRMLNGGRARAMGVSKFLTAILVVLAVVTLATFLLGDRLYHWLLRAGSSDEISARDEIVELNRSVAQSVADLRQQHQDLQDRFEQTVARRKQKLPADVAGGERLVEQSQRERVAIERIAVLSEVETGVAAELKTDVKNLEQLQQDRMANADQLEAFVRKRLWICGALGSGLVGLVGAGGFLLGTGLRRRLNKTRNTCPLCLGEGTFEPAGDARSAGSGHVELDQVQCKNVIS